LLNACHIEINRKVGSVQKPNCLNLGTSPEHKVKGMEGKRKVTAGTGGADPADAPPSYQGGYRRVPVHQVQSLAAGS